MIFTGFLIIDGPHGNYCIERVQKGIWGLSYCMSKKSCPMFLVHSQYRNGKPPWTFSCRIQQPIKLDIDSEQRRIDKKVDPTAI